MQYTIWEVIWEIKPSPQPNIHPGSPWKNGYNERFNGTLRHEVLDPEAFYSLAEAQTVIEQWVHQYNHTRPHQSLDNRAPVLETIAPVLSQNPDIPRELDKRAAAGYSSSISQCGSSPRLWGTPLWSKYQCSFYRFIPTPVGNT